MRDEGANSVEAELGLADLCACRRAIEEIVAAGVDGSALVEDRLDDLHFRIKRASIDCLADAKAMAALARYLRALPGREGEARAIEAWLLYRLGDDAEAG